MAELDPALKELVEAARLGAQPSPFEKSRAERRLQIRLAAAPTRSDHGRSWARPPFFRRAIFAAMAKTMIASTAAAALIGGAVVLHDEVTVRRPRAVSSNPTRPVTRRSPVEMVAAMEETRAHPTVALAAGSDEPVTLPSRVPDRPPPRRAPRPPAGRPSDFVEEVEALGELQRLLVRRDYERALSAIERQEATFPAGALRPEREAVRLVALCSLGRLAADDRGVLAFLRRWPRNPLSPRVRQACAAHSAESQDPSQDLSDEPPGAATHGREDAP